MSNEKLLPCPCCRSTDLLGGEHAWDDCVYCRTCGLRAITPDAWNTRALPTEPSAEMVEAVARALAVQDGYDPNEMWQEFNRDAAATDLMCGGVPDEEIFPTYVRWKEYQSEATVACRAVLAQLREAKP